MDSIVRKIDKKGAIFSAQGNVYLVIKGNTLILNPSWVKKVCDKYKTDGIVLLKDVVILNEKRGKYLKGEYLIYNPDGSYSLISGNGLACASAYISKYYRFQGEPLIFYNDYIEATVIPNREGGFFVGFRKTDFITPYHLSLSKDLAQELGLKAVPSEIEAYYLEMPNEHLVILLERFQGNLKSLPLRDIAERVKKETSLDANISLVKPILEERTPLEQKVRDILARGKYEVRVWERGAGETGSCGSAAAAITNLLIHLGANLPEYKFYMPGGVIKTLYSEPTIYVESKPEFLREVDLFS